MPASSAVQIFGEKHLNGAKIFLNEVSKITKKVVFIITLKAAA